MNFYLPDFCNKNFKLNKKIIQLMNQHPEYFYDNIQIGSVYGAFPNSIWNGGRVVIGDEYSKEKIEEIIYFYNSHKIPLRYTFTNSLIKSEHLNNKYCNLILECSNNGMNEILINSLELEQFLRKKYPNFKYILSTTRCERDIFKINEATKNYDLVVIDYRDNRNLNFLNAIEDKSKIEILINSYCDPGCLVRKIHYDIISFHQLKNEPMNILDEQLFCFCPTGSRTFKESLLLDSVLTKEEIYSTYSQMGFQNFKIEGREFSVFQVIESYLYYLIKPEYQDIVKNILLSLYQ